MICPDCNNTRVTGEHHEQCETCVGGGGAVRRRYGGDVDSEEEVVRDTPPSSEASSDEEPRTPPQSPRASPPVCPGAPRRRRVRVARPGAVMLLGGFNSYKDSDGQHKGCIPNVFKCSECSCVGWPDCRGADGEPCSECRCTFCETCGVPTDFSEVCCHDHLSVQPHYLLDAAGEPVEPANVPTYAHLNLLASTGDVEATEKHLGNMHGVMLSQIQCLKRRSDQHFRSYASLYNENKKLKRGLEKCYNSLQDYKKICYMFNTRETIDEEMRILAEERAERDPDSADEILQSIHERSLQ